MRISKFMLVAVLFIAASFMGCKPPADAGKPNLMENLNSQNNGVKYEQNIVTITPDNTTTIVNDEFAFTINVSGTMEPIRKATINSKEDGTCVAYLAKEKREPGTLGELEIGTRVKAGDILVELEERTMDQQVVNLETQLKTMKYGVGTDKVNEAESGLAIAKKNFDNMKELYKKKSITETQYDAAKMQYEQAQAGYDKLMLTIEALEKNLEVLKIRQADLLVRAPFDGRITKVYINLGELAAGMAKTPVVSMVDDSILYFTFGVPEEYANFVNNETTLRITLNNRVLENVKITTISPLVDSMNRSIQCQARIINNSKDPIVAGIFAKAEVTFKLAGTFVPETAIVSDEDQDFVFVETNMGFQKTRVTTGMTSDVMKNSSDRMVQIIIGLGQSDLADAKIIKVCRQRMLDADQITYDTMNQNGNHNQPVGNNNPGMNQ